MNKKPGPLSDPSAQDKAQATPTTPFLAVDLTNAQAARLAEGRPILRLSVEGVAKAEFPKDEGLRLGCPLFAQGTDAMCLAEILSEVGFPGEMLVLAPRLPNPGLVEQELRSAARGFRIRLICD